MTRLLTELVRNKQICEQLGVLENAAAKPLADKIRRSEDFSPRRTRSLDLRPSPFKSFRTPAARKTNRQPFVSETTAQNKFKCIHCS